MNKRISLGAAVAFAILVAAATFSMTMIYAQNDFNSKSADLENRRTMYAKFADVETAVRENYTGVINETLLMDSVARGYIAGLGDQYASYISAEEYKKLTQTKEGEDVGIGAVLELAPGGYLLVTEVYPDSPAQVAGIAVDDLIVKIDETNLTPENVEQAQNLIQGEAGTKLSLVVRKGSEDITITDLTRRLVSVPSVYSRIIEGTGAGYIMIKQFNDNTADQFNREFNKVVEAGAECLIFDVRDNKGSSLPSAVRIIDKLVPSGVIYSAKYKDGNVEVKETTSPNEIMLPMVVLTNAGTSSAAELFAQDLKDFGKASTVGAATMGKGVILKRILLSDRSAIELVVATISTNSGETFDGTGVKADYEVQGDGDWTNQDENTDPQLKKALEVVLAMRKVEDTIKNETGESSEPAPQPEPPVQSVPQPESSAPESVPEPESSESGESESESSADETSGDEPSSDVSSEDGRLDSDRSESG